MEYYSAYFWATVPAALGMMAEHLYSRRAPRRVPPGSGGALSPFRPLVILWSGAALMWVIACAVAYGLAVSVDGGWPIGALIGILCLPGLWACCWLTETYIRAVRTPPYLTGTDRNDFSVARTMTVVETAVVVLQVAGGHSLRQPRRARPSR